MAITICTLYFYRLSGTGAIPPDEPRYLAIGRAMTQTGDWITPKLWGSPWFEKPPLLYWMTALGTACGLGPELSGRIPVALLSVAFLVVAFFLLRSEFGRQPALAAVLLLATSAGWLTYSELCLTDLPMSVFFTLALFIALPLIGGHWDGRKMRFRFAVIGVLLGLATLAKGLVPIALALPCLWFLRQWWRDWWIAAVACFLVAGPWYIAVYEVNGFPFIEEFFLRHHLERLYSASLQHVQPWWYYFPVLAGGLLPWSPLVGLLGGLRFRDDRRFRFLATVILFGFFLFSVSLNKLPGYLLPLFPALFVLIGASFQTKPMFEVRRVWFIACAVLIACVPIVANVLPQALRFGRLSWRVAAPAFSGITRIEFFYIALPIAVVILARRSWAPVLLMLSLAANVLYLKDVAYPVLDKAVSARSLWQQIRPFANKVCEDRVSRDWLYGLQFYKGSVIPACDSRSKCSYVLRANGHEPPLLQSVK